MSSEVDQSGEGHVPPPRDIDIQDVLGTPECQAIAAIIDLIVAGGRPTLARVFRQELDDAAADVANAWRHGPRLDPPWRPWMHLDDDDHGWMPEVVSKAWRPLNLLLDAAAASWVGNVLSVETVEMADRLHLTDLRKHRLIADQDPPYLSLGTMIYGHLDEAHVTSAATQGLHVEDRLLLAAEAIRSAGSL